MDLLKAPPLPELGPKAGGEYSWRCLGIILDFSPFIPKVSTLLNLYPFQT
jgi:hypothetical protein